MMAKAMETKRPYFFVGSSVEGLSVAQALMYLIEVMDNRGNGKIYPDLNKETPYVVVRLVR